jgi:hypothetical protein
MGLEPDIGEQIPQPVHRLGRESAEDVLKVGEGIDVVVLARAGHGVQDGRRTATAVTPQERPVPSLMLSSALTSLCPVPDNAEPTYAGPQSPGSA